MTITANPDQLAPVAAELRQAAQLATDVAGSVHRGLGLGELALAGSLDPVGALAFEVAAMRVLTGPFGLALLGHDLDALSSAVVRAAREYGDTEAQLTRAALAAILEQPGATWRALGPLSHGDLTGAVNAYFSYDTALVDVFASVPYIGLLVREFADHYPDGRPQVTDLGPAPYFLAPPRGITDVMTSLQQLDATRITGQGDIEIQTLTGTNAAGQLTRKVIVYLPGMDDWGSLLRTSDVATLGTAAIALQGRVTTYERGVLAALRAARINASDDVMLVGHSLGGLVAVNTARDVARSGEFRVTHVITAGSPIGHLLDGLPPSTRVLALENRGDPVAHLDGTANPQRGNVTTVTVDQDHERSDTNHSLDPSYVDGTAEIAASRAPAVRSYLDGAADYFEQIDASTERYSIVRVFD
jgi:pimeloyl-ACP methyl ester carboxylesterase